MYSKGASITECGIAMDRGCKEHHISLLLTLLY